MMSDIDGFGFGRVAREVRYVPLQRRSCLPLISPKGHALLVFRMGLSVGCRGGGR